MYQLTCSIVLYENDPEQLLKAINSVLNNKIRFRLFLVDNSSTQKLKTILSDCLKDERIEYVYTKNNVGFGAGHNVAIKEIINSSPYHLILNPDVSFDGGILQTLLNYMDKNNDVGIIAPKVLNPDHSVQYLSKLLPTPFDFFIIRYLPFAFKKQQDNFRLKQSGYDKLINVPFLSGCFMIFNTSALKKTGLFDENIFMYTEDIDITRRMIEASYKTIFYPFVCICHHHERKSFTNFKVFKMYLKSTIYYFNKWGWFFDKERRRINKLILTQLQQE